MKKIFKVKCGSVITIFGQKFKLSLDSPIVYQIRQYEMEFMKNNILCSATLNNGENSRMTPQNLHILVIFRVYLFLLFENPCQSSEKLSLHTVGYNF